MIPNRLKYIAAAALLSLCQPVLASDWQPVAASSKAEIFIDQDSIRFTGDTARAWGKWVYTEPQELARSYPKQTYQSHKVLEVYNCTARATATKQGVFYATADGGDVVSTLNFKDSELDFSEVTPDTVGEAQLDWVCQQKPARRR